MDERIIEARVRNTLHTAVIVTGMLLLAAVAARMIVGPGVAPWLVAALIAGGLVGPRPHPERLLRWSGGRPLPGHVAVRLTPAVATLAARAGLERPPALLRFARPEPNAFALGDRRRSAIGLTSGLLERLEDEEIVAILAHEISHLRNGDARVMAIAASAARLAALMSATGTFLVLTNLPLLLAGVARVSWTALLLLTAAPVLATVLQLSLSRAREIDADLSAVELTDDPDALARALIKIQTPQRRMLERIWTETYGGTWWRTHPATEQRIRVLREIAGRSRARSASSG